MADIHAEFEPFRDAINLLPVDCTLKEYVATENDDENIRVAKAPLRTFRFVENSRRVLCPPGTSIDVIFDADGLLVAFQVSVTKT